MSMSDTIEESTATLLDGSVWDRDTFHKEHNNKVLDSLVYTPVDWTIIEDLEPTDGHIDACIHRCLLTTSILRHVQEKEMAVAKDQAAWLKVAEEELQGLRSVKEAITTAEAKRKKTEDALF